MTPLTPLEWLTGKFAIGPSATMVTSLFYLPRAPPSAFSISTPAANAVEKWFLEIEGIGLSVSMVALH